jgi:hypothetical protein
LVQGYYEELKRRREAKWKDTIFENLMKGTAIVDDEETVKKSHERRQERRRKEMEEIAALKAKKVAKKGGPAAKYASNRSGASRSKIAVDSSSEDDDIDDDPARYRLPSQPVFNSLPPSLEYIHRLIVKCTDPKFLQEKPTKRGK